ncbi:hypothetical protein QR680_017788 [Steinernema hermaphroditum]|uniref:Uncharacterized protein n=1 Tax=Steinernema hermaphroditum TaxID=289476 RepID=A0AA39HI69_9BILA|nr:hypothetical protein QR680_017788 [Steinernema hermaphroditum]
MAQRRTHLDRHHSRIVSSPARILILLAMHMPREFALCFKIYTLNHLKCTVGHPTSTLHTPTMKFLSLVFVAFFVLSVFAPTEASWLFGNDEAKKPESIGPCIKGACPQGFKCEENACYKKD